MGREGARARFLCGQPTPYNNIIRNENEACEVYSVYTTGLK